MKNIFISTILAVVCTVGFAQTNPRVTGPKAKNAKAWGKDTNFGGVHAAIQVDEFGGKAKNKKHVYSPHTLTLNTTTDRTVVQGPKAKNQKIWKD